MPQLKILLLGGTGEASALAGLLANDPRFSTILSLAGRTKAPVLPAIPCRIGGFGGVSGLARYLHDNAIQVLVVATHPFAAQIRQNAVGAARATGTRLLLIERPAWEQETGDCWTEASPTLSRRANRPYSDKRCDGYNNSNKTGS